MNVFKINFGFLTYLTSLSDWRLLTCTCTPTYRPKYLTQNSPLVNEGNFPKMLNNIVDNEVDTVTYEQICGT